MTDHTMTASAFDRERAISDLMRWHDEHLDRIGQRGVVVIERGQRVNLTALRREHLDEMDDWKLWKEWQTWKQRHIPSLPSNVIRICTRGA